MADEADMANDKSEMELEFALRRRLPEGPELTGYCHECGEAVSETRRFCDADCRDMYEKRQKAAALHCNRFLAW